MTPTSHRILFLTPFPPRLDGTHGGSRTIARTIAGLAEHHKIAILALQRPEDPDIDPQARAATETYTAVEIQHPKRPLGRSWKHLQRRRGLLSGTPLAVTNNWSREFLAEAQHLIASWEPDILQIEFDVMGQYARRLSAVVPTVLTVHEPGIVSAYEGREARGALLRHLERRAWERHSRELLEAVDAVVVFTERDRNLLGNSATPIVVIAPGAGAAASATPPAAGSQLLFVGNFVHPPNAEAALFLVREIFPLVRRDRPDSTLVIIGPDPPQALRAYHGNGIFVLGRVADVAPFQRASAIVTAPLLSGGGIRIKVLEALAGGSAIVATPLAVAGLELPEHEAVLVAESAEDFAARIVELLNDPERRNELGRRAAWWAAEHLSPRAATVQYETLYASLARKPSA